MARPSFRLMVFGRSEFLMWWGFMYSTNEATEASLSLCFCPTGKTTPIFFCGKCFRVNAMADA